MPSARALACPASLKGVLSARDAAAALAEGLREWADADELAVADGGEVVRELPAPTRVACDVDVPLLDAARVFSAQKGASLEQARELEERLSAIEELRGVADLPGAGAAGGLGAALAALGAELLPGAQ